MKIQEKEECRMKRKIVKIDEEKCNGCGLCVSACHEGALQLINGKAKLVSENYCDGLGDCLPECPTNAITIEEREALPFDEEAVKKHMETKKMITETLACGCPGSHARTIDKKQVPASPKTAPVMPAVSELRQWPCQIKLVPIHAPYFDNAHLLIAADCTAYAYANIHEDFMRNKITLIGCPKLDNVNYAEKITEILKAHVIKSITVLRMEVPCCSGIAGAVKEALINSGKMIPWRIVIIGTDGSIIEE
jgi:NAD-dependent dihydropyrimidine dehydrogenase PreA subunit